MPKNTILVSVLAAFTLLASGAISVATAEKGEPTVGARSPSSDAKQSEASEAATHTKAYDKARTFGGDPKAGVVLHLHGCDGLFIHKGWQREWVRFLTGKGYLVIAPDSFADRRPRIRCPSKYKNDVRIDGTSDKIKIYAIRKKQTEYSLKRIRETYPNARIYIWGHSEGGALAHRIDEKVSGIIATGYECGRGSALSTKIRKDVPLLVILGTNDPYYREWNGLGYYGSLEEQCTHFIKSPLWRYEIIDGMGHAASLRYVKSTLNGFLGFAQSHASKSVDLTEPSCTLSPGVAHDACIDLKDKRVVDTEYGKKFTIFVDIKNTGDRSYNATWFTTYLCNDVSSSIEIFRKGINRTMLPGDTVQIELPFSLTKSIWDDANEEYFRKLRICNSRLEVDAGGKWASIRFDD